MERRLILMRHAKSAWGTLARSDHERSLNERGRRDAPRIARRLAQLGWAPDAVLSSDSQRTRETWDGMTAAFDDPPEPLFTHALYHAGLEDIWAEAHHLDPETETVLVLGHNPGWEYALHLLTGQSETMTTGNAALLEGAGDDWPAALRGRWRMTDLLRPKELSED